MVLDYDQGLWIEDRVGPDLSADENGIFEIAVIPGKTFQLSAYNYKDKYQASYSVIIAAIASGDMSEN